MEISTLVKYLFTRKPYLDKMDLSKQWTRSINFRSGFKQGFGMSIYPAWDYYEMGVDSWTYKNRLTAGQAAPTTRTSFL